VKPKHLDLIRQVYDAMNRRDVAALKRFGAAHPDFEWTSSAEEPDGGSHMGPAEALAYSRDLFETFDRLETQVEQEIALDATHAVFLVRHRIRGAASGAEADRREVHLWTVDGERVTSLREFATLEEARVAAGAG
jgi:ketosteroid isomerase-like protein